MTVGDSNVYLVDEHVSKGRGSRDKTYTPSNEAPRHRGTETRVGEGQYP